MAKWTPDEIFLNDESIVNWRQPVPDGSVWMSPINASTVLLGHINTETTYKNTIKYIVATTATKYRALIQRINLRGTWDILPIQEEILFSGGITILEDGEIPWTHFSGHRVRRVGKIWTASVNEDASLEEIILGNEPSEYSARIAAILRWYEKQEETEETNRRMERRPISF